MPPLIIEVAEIVQRDPNQINPSDPQRDHHQRLRLKPEP